MSHGDPKLIILIFLQSVILKVLDILDLKDIFLLKILIILNLFLLHNLFVSSIDQVVSQLIPPDVEKVYNINNKHGKTYYKNSKSIVEEMSVKCQEGIEYTIESTKITISTFLVDSSLEPIIVDIDGKDITKCQSKKSQFSQNINNISHDSITKML